MLCQVHKKLGGGTAKLSQGLFHTIWRHAQYRNWGELAGGQQSLLRDWLGAGRRVVSGCITGFFFPWVLFLSHSLIVFLLITICCYYYYFVPIIKLFLSQPTSFLTFALPILSPIPPGGVRERLCGA